MEILTKMGFHFPQGVCRKNSPKDQSIQDMLRKHALKLQWLNKKSLLKI